MTEERYEKNAKLLFDGFLYSELPNFLELDDLSECTINILKKIKNSEYSIYKTYESGIVKEIKGLTPPAYIHKWGSEPILFYEYKKNLGLREIYIPNIILYLAFIFNTMRVCESIFDIIYKEETSKSQFSNSYIMFDGDFYVVTDYDGNEIDLDSGDFVINNDKTISQLSYKTNTYRYLKSMGSSTYSLKLDLESFYPNVYTHMLSQMKNFEPFKCFEENAEYFEFLDYYNMKANNNQTKGIMAGTFSSRISSELLLLTIDDRIKKLIEDKSIRYIRYVDDFTFFSDSKEKIKAIIPEIQNILSEYRLRINSNKTEIQENIFNINSIDSTELASIFTVPNKIDKDFFINIKSTISQYVKANDFPMIKGILSLIKRHIINGNLVLDLVNEIDILGFFINYLLQLIEFNHTLCVRVYMLIDVILNKVKNVNENYVNLIIECLKYKSELINKTHRNSIMQIWHYYILNKYNSTNSIKYFRELKDSISDINPLILVTFIKRGNNKNQYLMKYIKEKYSDDINSINGEWKTSIILSKWWYPLLLINLVDGKDYYTYFNSNHFPDILKDLCEDYRSIYEDDEEGSYENDWEI